MNQIKVKKEIEVFMDIEFPYITKDIINVFKFTSEKICIQVQHSEFTTAIIKHSNFPETWMTYEPATEAEFQEKLIEVIGILDDMA